MKAFQMSKQKAQELDKLYVPKRQDQLVVTSDYAEKGTDMSQGTSATLWAQVKGDWRVVSRCSAELSPQQINLDPCNGEAAAIYMAAKNPIFTHYIKVAEKKTLALVDSKPLMEAAKLLKNFRH